MWFLENIRKGIQGKRSFERTHFNNCGCKEESIRSKGREIVTMVWTRKQNARKYTAVEKWNQRESEGREDHKKDGWV
jgi:hypothetical protein